MTSAATCWSGLRAGTLACAAPRSYTPAALALPQRRANEVTRFCCSTSVAPVRYNYALRYTDVRRDLRQHAPQCHSKRAHKHSSPNEQARYPTTLHNLR